MPRAEGKDDDGDGGKEDDGDGIPQGAVDFMAYGLSDDFESIRQAFIADNCAGFEDADELLRSGAGYPLEWSRVYDDYVDIYETLHRREDRVALRLHLGVADEPERVDLLQFEEAVRRRLRRVGREGVRGRLDVARRGRRGRGEGRQIREERPPRRRRQRLREGHRGLDDAHGLDSQDGSDDRRRRGGRVRHDDAVVHDDDAWVGALKRAYLDVRAEAGVLGRELRLDEFGHVRDLVASSRGLGLRPLQDLLALLVEVLTETKLNQVVEHNHGESHLSLQTYTDFVVMDSSSF